MLQRKFNDRKLKELLAIVGLDVIVDREGGWDSVKDWKNVLAGGDK